MQIKLYESFPQSLKIELYLLYVYVCVSVYVYACYHLCTANTNPKYLHTEKYS
jgi:hypothetical protein